jgi:hypothetical protein
MGFSIKGATKSVMTEGKTVVIVLAGALASRKFLDFDTMFATQPADGYLRKHQGAIKFLGATIATGFVKNKMVKELLMGVALEGGIKAVRTYGGGNFFQPLGEEDMGGADAELQELLNGADDDSLLGSVNNQYAASVAGADLTANSSNAVSGMPNYGNPYLNGYNANDGWS